MWHSLLESRDGVSSCFTKLVHMAEKFRVNVCLRRIELRYASMKSAMH